VHSSDSNFFMLDLLNKINENFVSLGIESEVVTDEFPRTRNANYILIGHEWKSPRNNFSFPSRSVIARSICLITENPGSPWFDYSVEMKNIFHKFIFINEGSMQAFPAPAQKKVFFQLFNEERATFDNFDSWKVRNFSLNFTGGLDSARKRKLAELSKFFASQNSFLSLSPTKLHNEVQNYQISSAEFSQQLSKTKILINIHRENTSNLEWFRILKAIEVGTVVFSEKCLDSSNADSLELLRYFDRDTDFGAELLDEKALYNFADQASIRAIRLKDFNDGERLAFFLKGQSLLIKYIPLSVRKPRFVLIELSKHFLKKIFTKLNQLKFRIPEYSQAFYLLSNMMRNQKNLYLSNLDLGRRIAILQLGKVPPERIEIVQDGRKLNSPVVTIAVPFFDEGKILTRTLESISRIEFENDFEVLLCSDAGTQETLDIAISYFAESNLSYAIFKRVVNGGVGASRNDLLSAARGKYVLTLDADNTLFPRGPHLLYEAIKSNESAAFAYGVLAVNEGNQLVDVMNYLPWDPTYFRKVGNYIDAFALLDKEKILAIGGFTESLPLYGWEDFDLWARLASEKEFGVFTSNFIGTYFKRAGSMLGVTNMDIQDAALEIRERSPGIWNA
jgi:Glycosyl transferase family 2